MAVSLMDMGACRAGGGIAATGDLGDAAWTECVVPLLEASLLAWSGLLVFLCGRDWFLAAGARVVRHRSAEAVAGGARGGGVALAAS